MEVLDVRLGNTPRSEYRGRRKNFKDQALRKFQNMKVENQREWCPGSKEKTAF